SREAPTCRRRLTVSAISHSSSIFPPRQRPIVRAPNSTSPPAGGRPFRAEPASTRQAARHELRAPARCRQRQRADDEHRRARPRRRARRAAIVAARRVGLTTRNLTLPLRALVVAWRRQPAEQWATLVALRVLRPVSEAQPRARVPAVDRKLSPE